LRVVASLSYSGRVLKIPRFDRRRDPLGFMRIGQESLVSALGVANFAYNASHFEYLDVILKYCTDPKTEIIEYVLRDVLNLAMGNTDNHGRNTALQKFGNWIGLAPLYDFAPMALLERNAPRPTRWPRDLTTDYNPDWRLITEEIENLSDGLVTAGELQAALTGKIGFIWELEECAEFEGVDLEVIENCFSRHRDILETIRELA
jgi:serine/threonine-protein kinase HipA